MYHEVDFVHDRKKKREVVYLNDYNKSYRKC